MEKQDVTFTFFGMKNQKFDCLAVCQTEGGPEPLDRSWRENGWAHQSGSGAEKREKKKTKGSGAGSSLCRYEVALKGQASRLDFRLDKTELDFGEIPYTEVWGSIGCLQLCVAPKKNSTQNNPYTTSDSRGAGA